MAVLRSNKALLARFREGHRDALEDVYWAYVGRVSAILRFGCRSVSGAGRIGGALNDAAVLADLVQEVFYLAFRREARLAYDGVRDYGPYLFAIARNVLIRWRRQQGREVLADEIDLEAIIDAAGAAEADDADDLPWCDPDARSAVEGYLAGLPPELHSVYEKRFKEGRSQLQAAGELGLSRQQLRTREAKLLSGLRKALSRAGLGARAAALMTFFA